MIRDKTWKGFENFDSRVSIERNWGDDEECLGVQKTWENKRSKIEIQSYGQVLANHKLALPKMYNSGCERRNRGALEKASARRSSFTVGQSFPKGRSVTNEFCYARIVAESQVY